MNARVSRNAFPEAKDAAVPIIELPSLDYAKRELSLDSASARRALPTESVPARIVGRLPLQRQYRRAGYDMEPPAGIETATADYDATRVKSHAQNIFVFRNAHNDLRNG